MLINVIILTFFCSEICLSEEDSQCKGIEEDYGGSWYCFPDAGLGNPVPSGTK